MKRRDLLRAALSVPIGGFLSRFELMAAPARKQVKITAIKAMQTADTGTIIKIETDAGLVGRSGGAMGHRRKSDEDTAAWPLGYS